MLWLGVTVLDIATDPVIFEGWHNDILLTGRTHLSWPRFFAKRRGLVPQNKLKPATFYCCDCTKSEKRAAMYMCVGGMDFSLFLRFPGTFINDEIVEE